MEARPRRLTASFLRFFFKHLYTTVAWGYDWVAWITSMGQWHSWQSAAVRQYPPGRVLELGHGPGHVLVDLVHAGNAAYGLDPSVQMSAIASRRIMKLGLTACLVRGLAQALPFAPGSIRTIVATFPSDYMFDEKTLSEILRVLPEKGELVVIGVASITGHALYDRIAAWLYRITRQSGEPERGWLESLSGSGLHAWFEIVQQERARVVRFRAVKSSRLASPGNGKTQGMWQGTMN